MLEAFRISRGLSGWGTFVDHGPNLEDSEASRRVYDSYKKIAEKAKHLTVKPGDGLSMKDVTVKVLTNALAPLLKRGGGFLGEPK